MMNKTDIKNIFGQIQTPEYDPINDIKNKINRGCKIKPGMSHMKRVLIIAAVVMTVLILMSATERMIRMIIFDADGNSYIRYIPFFERFRPFKYDEQSVFEREFDAQENNENLLRYVNRKDGNISWSPPYRNIYDYNEFLKYTDGEIFKIPQYIPDGYIFDNATVYFFIDENFDFDNAELIYREEKFGNIYEKYYIQENLYNIQGLTVWYAKEAGHDEDFICYSIELKNDNINDITYGGNERTVFEKFDMPQFYSAVLLAKTWGDSEEQITDYNFHAYNMISPKRYYSFFNKNIESKGQIPLAPNQYGIVGYYVVSHTAPRDEIIKMAESIR